MWVVTPRSRIALPGAEAVVVALVYTPALAEYRFAPGHPMLPERFSLAVALMRARGLLEPVASTGPSAEAGDTRAVVWEPHPAADEDLLRAHSADYIAAVRRASSDPAAADPGYGIGPGDTPAFLGMHDAAALAVGATILALDAVLDGRALRTFNPAGGLHHAMRSRASGFCIYNDIVVAIERAIAARPGLKVAYVDIDAHHGDGVEAAFWRRSDVLTCSIHESGHYLFPGTGFAEDTGDGEGHGTSVNVPLPPGAGDAQYAETFDTVVAPAVRSFAPDVVVAQLGADSLAGDPLTHLECTVAGHGELVRRIRDLAEEVCSGRLAALGGGGYQPFTEVPEAWAQAMAILLEATER